MEDTLTPVVAACGVAVLDVDKSAVTYTRPRSLALKIQENDLKSAGTSPTSPRGRFSYGDEGDVRRMDIDFEDLSYQVKVGVLRKSIKTILNGVTGSFKAGELSAIMGPSGSGKSTLLNILSGYTVFNISGDIRVNGAPRDLKSFIPQLAYITQDADLHQYLTVAEAMHFSVSLKVGKHMSNKAKRDRVRKILNAIGMSDARHTMSVDLSGGQRKRLAIALELVSDPPVLILDEPTSGLDSSTSNQCISLLKKLAMEGRTVICTIHQPSALLFGMFDHLYTLADGHCIYSGGVTNVVPFLGQLNLHCPESYNPADYLLEIATNDYGEQNPRLIEKTQNGANGAYRKCGPHTAQINALNKVEKMMEAGLMTPVEAPQISSPLISPSSLHTIKEISSSNDLPSKSSDIKKRNSLASVKFSAKDHIYASPFHQQLILLLKRSFLILWRDKSLTAMRVIIHLIMSTLVGFLYFGIGNDGSNALNNFRYIFYTSMFIMYTAFSSITVRIPLELPIISKEHFNRWYSLRAYYIALTLADFPIQFLCTAIFIGVSYGLTQQPFELFRLAMFFLMILMSALAGQSIGLIVGAMMNLKMGAIFGPFFICPFLIFSGFFLSLNDAPGWLHWIFHMSFLKYTLEGSALAIFGYDRPKMDCNEIYCHFSRPQQLLRQLGMDQGSYGFAVIALVTTFIGLRILAFYIMSFRLRLFR